MFKASNFPVPTKRAIAGLSLRATDTDWTFGSGPEVAGPAHRDLLMAMATQPPSTSLRGDGVATLRDAE